MTHQARKFLVLGRVGDASLHANWIADRATPRTWDLRLNAYGNDESRIQDGDFPPVIDRGTKWDSIARHFKNNPELLDLYDYVMLPDDDLQMDVTTINRVFEIVVKYDLTMAQPSLSYESYFSYPILLKCPHFRLRYTNYLESMSCCIKTSFLKKLLPMFEVHFTGWGTDLVWTLLMDNPAYKAAVIDEVSMTHTRPLMIGPIYQTFKATGTNPYREIENVRANFLDAPTEMLVYGGILASGKKVGPIGARILHGTYLLRSFLRARNHWLTLRFGLVTLLRAMTRRRYLPQKLTSAPGSAASVWFEETRIP